MADSNRDQNGVWTQIWRRDFSKDEHVFSLESERRSVRWQKIKNLILKKYESFSSLKIIEIGSGRGTYGLLTGLEGASVSLLDKEPLAFERARDFFGFWGKSFEAISADAFDLPEELLGQFDVVMSYGFAEHFRYPERLQVFESHLKLLKPNGLLIVSVPNRVFLPYRIGKFLLERLGRWVFGLEIPFSRKELGQIAVKLGLNHWRVMGSGLINDTLNFWLIQRLFHLPRYLWERFLFFLRRDTRGNVARLKDRFFYFPYQQKTWLDDYFGYALILVGEKPHDGAAVYDDCSTDETAHSFDADYFEKGAGTLFKKGYHKQTVVDYWKPVLDYILKLYWPERVLEIGCAKGFLIEELRGRGITAYGVDISEYAISEAASEIKPFLKQCDVSDASLPYPEEFFDLILSFETLEHLTHPEKALAEMSRVLKRSGRIFISTPSPGTEVAAADITHVNVRSWRNWVSGFNQYGIQLNRIYPWMWNPDIGRLGSFPEPWRTEIRKVIYTFLEILDMKLHIYGFGQKLL